VPLQKRHNRSASVCWPVALKKWNQMEPRSFSWRGKTLPLFFFCALGMSNLASAQQIDPAIAPAPAQPQTTGVAVADPALSPAQPTSTPQSPKNDRIFFALPNYLTVENASNLPPLSTHMKFKAVAEGCFDPVEFTFIGVQAAIGQADDTDPTYHQGLRGYSRRFGTAYADAIIGNFGTSAIFPTLLHQDPRYFQKGKGNFFHRFGYAAIRIVVTRSESSGKAEFNFSEFLGNGMAAGLANTYHPGPHTIGGSADVLGTQLILDTLGYELKEFWPDLRRVIERSRHKT